MVKFAIGCWPGPTVTDLLVVPVRPLLSATVSVTAKVPADVYRRDVV